jgi:hypothetical protein
VQWGIALPFAAMIGATLIGMLLHLPPYSPLRVMPGYSLNVIWSLCSIAVLALAIQICVEPPRRRLNERFASDEPAILALPDNRTISCVVSDLSVGGAQLRSPAGAAEQWNGITPGRLTFVRDGTTLKFQPVRVKAGDLAVKFDDDARTRRLMISKIFTGSYRNGVEHISRWTVLSRSTQALFR